MSQLQAVEDEPRPSSTVRRIWRWSSRLRSVWSWMTGHSPMGAVVLTTAAGLAVAPPVIRMTFLAHDADKRAAIRQPLGIDATLYAFSGRDAKGRIAEFDLIVLHKDIAWVKGSTSEIMRGSNSLDPGQFKRLIFDKEVGNRIAVSRQLIAVGAASQEGDQSAEELRAKERARRIAGWLSEASGAAKSIWTLSLGQYSDPCVRCETSETSWQRPVIIIGLRRTDAGLVLHEALADALDGVTNLPNRSRYTKFDLQKFL